MSSAAENSGYVIDKKADGMTSDDWKIEAVSRWSAVASKSISLGVPWLLQPLYDVAKKYYSSGKLPKGVTADIYVKAVTDAFKCDPKFEWFCDEKGLDCLWFSSPEYGPTRPKHATSNLVPVGSPPIVDSTEKIAPLLAQLLKVITGPISIQALDKAFRLEFKKPLAPDRATICEIIKRFPKHLKFITLREAPKYGLRNSGVVPVPMASSSLMKNTNLSDSQSSIIAGKNKDTAGSSADAITFEFLYGSPQRILNLSSSQRRTGGSSAAGSSVPEEGDGNSGSDSYGSGDDEEEDESAYVEEKMVDLFFGGHSKAPRRCQSLFLSGAEFHDGNADREGGLLGRQIITGTSTQSSEVIDDNQVYLNVERPFCLLVVGAQGSGQSHTLNVVLENCLVKCSLPVCRPVTREPEGGACALVLQYDRSETAISETLGLLSLGSDLEDIMGRNRSTVRPVTRAIIYVSPWLFAQREKFYGKMFDVAPLLFSWTQLSVTQIMILLGVCDGDSEIQNVAVLELLKGYVRQNFIPSYDEFTKQLKTHISGSLGMPLSGRLEILDALIAESSRNAALAGKFKNLSANVKKSTLIVCDLTDPLLCMADLCRIFQVVINQFRGVRVRGCRKVLALEDAHKYFPSDNVPWNVSLLRELVDTARAIRHEDLRIVIGTQAPHALKIDILDFLTAAIIHKVNVPEWLSSLAVKMPTLSVCSTHVNSLEVGEAVIASTKFSSGVRKVGAGESPAIESLAGFKMIKIRPRITRDYGTTW
jgi:hypothetical protein